MQRTATTRIQDVFHRWDPATAMRYRVDMAIDTFPNLRDLPFKNCCQNRLLHRVRSLMCFGKWIRPLQLHDAHLF